MDFQTDTVVALANAVRSGEVSARELVSHALARIEALNPAVNAFVAVDADAALAEAAALDDRQARGDEVGALAGIPLAVKDLEDAAGLPTTYGSAALGTVEGAVADSELVARLRQAGAIVVGKTNTPEFGFAPQTWNPRFGTTANPWDPRRTPGGSSGGSAAAIASGMVPLATGSDGGGSLRIPSAVCGLSGFKPSLGRVPSGGPQPPDWPLLSTKGTMAWRTIDLAASLDSVIGPDPTDLRSLPIPESSWRRAVEDPGLPMSMAWSADLGYGAVDREVLAICQAAVEALSRLGATIEELPVVWAADPVFAWVTMEGSYLARSLGNLRDTPAWDDVTPELRDIVEAFGGGTALDLLGAEDECHVLNVRLVEVFRRHRLLLTPTVAGQTPFCGAQGTINGEETIGWVSFTYPFNMTRSPAGTVCAGRTADGMPVGLQIIGPQHGDLAVLRAMAAIEDVIGFTDRPDASLLA